MSPLKYVPFMERADGRRGDSSHSCGRIRASQSRADSTPAITASDANMPGLPIRLIAAPASRSAAASGRGEGIERRDGLGIRAERALHAWHRYAVRIPASTPRGGEWGRRAAAGLRRAAHARGGRAVPWDGPRLAGQGGAVPGGRLRTATGEEGSRWLDAWPWRPAEAGRGSAGHQSPRTPRPSLRGIADGSPVTVTVARVASGGVGNAGALSSLSRVRQRPRRPRPCGRDARLAERFGAGAVRRSPVPAPGDARPLG